MGFYNAFSLVVEQVCVVPLLSKGSLVFEVYQLGPEQSSCLSTVGICSSPFALSPYRFPEYPPYYFYLQDSHAGQLSHMHRMVS